MQLKGDGCIAHCLVILLPAGSFCDLVHVLLELGRNAEAEDLLKRAQAVSTFSATNREATAWWGPSALAGAFGMTATAFSKQQLLTAAWCLPVA